MSRIDETKDFIAVRIAVLTVSDTRDLAEDRSGDVLVGRIEVPGEEGFAAHGRPDQDLEGGAVTGRIPALGVQADEKLQAGAGMDRPLLVSSFRNVSCVDLLGRRGNLDLQK